MASETPSPGRAPGDGDEVFTPRTRDFTTGYPVSGLHQRRTQGPPPSPPRSGERASPFSDASNDAEAEREAADGGAESEGVERESSGASSERRRRGIFGSGARGGGPHLRGSLNPGRRGGTDDRGGGGTSANVRVEVERDVRLSLDKLPETSDLYPGWRWI